MGCCSDTKRLRPAVFRRVRWKNMLFFSTIFAASAATSDISEFSGGVFLMKKLTTKKIALTGILTALCVIANMFSISVIPNVSFLSLVATVCFLAGVILGAPLGFVVGFLGDLIAGFIAPKGAYNIIIGLSSGLIGFFPGLLYWLFKKKISAITNIKLRILTLIAFTALSFLVCFVVCTCGTNSFALWWYYFRAKKAFWVYLAGRIPVQSIISLINLALSAICLCTVACIPFFKNVLFFSSLDVDVKEPFKVDKTEDSIKN